MCRLSGGKAENGESRIKRQRSLRPGNAVGFSLSLSNSEHPTLLAPLAAPGGQTKRRMVVRKVTKINKSETPPPTTWPKARGSHTRCCSSSFPSQVFPSYASPRRAERRRPEEQLGSSHSASRGLAALLRCWGRKAKEATEQLAAITTTARFKVFKVIRKVEILLCLHVWR